MVLKWHLNVYCYTIAFMVTFLIFLMIPNQVDLSENNISYDKKLSRLADQNSRTTSAQERAVVARQLSALQKNKQKANVNSNVSLIPLRIFMILMMVLFIILTSQVLLQRNKIRAAMR